MPEPLNLDELFADDDRPQPAPHHTQPQPAPQYVPTQPPPHVVTQLPPPSGDRFTLIGFCVVAFFVGLYISTFSSCERRDRDDDEERQVINVTIDKPTALLLWDDTGTMSDDQADVVNTTKVQSWCEANGVDYRRYDVDDDLVKVEPKWPALKGVAAKPPSITVALPSGSVSTYVLPNSIDETISRISNVVK